MKDKRGGDDVKRQILSPGEIVIAVLFYSGQKKFSSDRETLQKIFYELKRSHPKIIKPISFGIKGVTPESVRLDQALSNMEAAGLVKRFNKSPRFYEIDESLNEAFDKYIVKKIRSAKINEKELQNIGKEFSEKLLELSN